MAYFHTTVLDNQIKALPTVSTPSGSVATFDTDLTENLVECECDIQYSQASGTPTPSNPIPITVYNALNLSHSGADTSNPTITNIPFGQTVAKGTLNVLSGQLEVDLLAIDLGSLSYNYFLAYTRFRTSAPINLIKKAINNNSISGLECVSSVYVLTTYNSTATVVDSFGIDTNGYLAIHDERFTDGTALKTALNGEYLVYNLETPLTLQLNANQITALLNENNIWCDTNGDTSVKYLLSVGKKIS